MRAPPAAPFLVLALAAAGCAEDARAPVVPGPADAGALDGAGPPDDVGSPLDVGNPLDAGSLLDVGSAADAARPIDSSAGGVGDAGHEGGRDAVAPADGGALCDPDELQAPTSILFVGNSFTFTEDMPSIVRDLAVHAGLPEPYVEMSVAGGRSLEWHRNDPASDAPARVREGWDVVVLQELSTRPTDAIGDPERFKDDATWFHDLAIMSRPTARVYLYETFARRAGHPYYPRTFLDPADMQAQLRFHYDDCAERYIPLYSMWPDVDVQVVRVGDAWEHQLAMGEPPRLHAADDYHPNAAGAYLTALVMFGTIFERSVIGQAAIGVDADVARQLQSTAEWAIAQAGVTLRVQCVRDLVPGAEVRVDFGTLRHPDWHAVASSPSSVGPLRDQTGAPTSIRVSVSGFDGAQTQGATANDLGLPPEVSEDSLWVGSFTDHATALGRTGRVVITGLMDGGRYDVELFASRTGDDAGRGRLTRYRIGAEERELECADNRGSVARFEEVVASSGQLEIEVGVSPGGGARFAYIGSLRITR